MEKSVATIMLAEGNLRSIVFASRPGIATFTKVDDCVEGEAAKVVCQGLTEGDYVVRSVRSGNRRFILLLAGTMPTIEGATYADSNRVEVADSDVIFVISGATLVVAPKGMIQAPNSANVRRALASDVSLVCVDEATLRAMQGGNQS